MYPMIIIDSRYDENIEYFAMPKEIIKDKNDTITLPIIEIIETDLKGKPGEFVAVMWNEMYGTENIKEYVVNDHLVMAGCDISSMIDKNGKLQCDEKKIYLVLHPMDEWLDHHVVELR